MIKLLKTAQQTVDTRSATVLNWDVRADYASGTPANHNLTREAREGNVVPLTTYMSEPDFRPDLGARISIAA
ncbi:hypothetical protein [Celeribacter sp.]|uniref:hypothetical protein n=1 Tax=Celeribacter sp. TaxID=1890673 RepID=UPI003A922180